jgi:FixJ family two-component response regulator
VMYGTNVPLDAPSAMSHGPLMVNTPPLITVVDDDMSVLKALTRLLRARGFNAVPYASAKEFLAALPATPPDCLVVDLQMPGMTGLELLQHLQREGLHIPTVVITAHGDADTLERCVTAGASSCLKKPLQDTSLFAAIAAATHSA